MTQEIVAMDPGRQVDFAIMGADRDAEIQMFVVEPGDEFLVCVIFYRENTNDVGVIRAVLAQAKRRGQDPAQFDQQHGPWGKAGNDF